jgi:FCD domain-containing protein
VDRLSERLGHAVKFAYRCWDRIVLSGYIERLLKIQSERAEKDQPLVDEDTAFHYTLAQAADNQLLVRLHNVILDLLRESRQIAAHVPGRPQMSLRGHESILEAVKAHDGEAGYRTSLAHIAEVRDGSMHALLNDQTAAPSLSEPPHPEIGNEAKLKPLPYRSLKPSALHRCWR